MLYYLKILVTLFCVLMLSAVYAKVPQHEALQQYYTSGKYIAEIEKKINDASEYLERQAQHPRAQRLAIVLDIDDTALSNYDDLVRLHFTRNPQALAGAYMLGGSPAIEPILALYQHALEKNISIFFISERPHTPEIVAMTSHNLKHAGFDQWEELILKPLDNNQSHSEFKLDMRKRITRLGFDIILNIGDQEADLKGGYAEVKVKIPNPFYALS